jgi:putative ABC transport system permease protein
MVLAKLAISNFRVRKVRSALTVAAIALSVSLVVAVTSGYRSMEGAALKFLNEFMGEADAFILPANDIQGKVPESLVTELKEDWSVREAVGRLESQRVMERKDTEEIAARAAKGDRTAAGGLAAAQINVQLIGIRRPGDTQSDSLDVSSGEWFNTATGNVAVMDQVGAKKIGVDVGDTIKLPGLKGNALELKVIGMVHKPTFFAEHSATVYLPLETLQHFTGQDNPPQVSRIAIKLRANSDLNQFAKHWTARLAAIDTNLHLRMRRDNAGDLENKLRALHILSYFGGVVSMITAMFITFSALSMGVTERQRTLAMLRAIGTTRSQMAQLVVLEGVILAAVGIFVGIIMGMIWTQLLYLRFSDIFVAGAMYSWGGILFGAAGAMVTALAASLLPAWTAARVSPLEAMNAFGSTGQKQRAPIGWAVLGLILASIDPLIFFGPLEQILRALGVADVDERARGIRFICHFAVGLPTVMLGYFLLAPMYVWVIERVFVPVIAPLMRVPKHLLRQQLSSGLWRAAGTGAALMVGLATLIVMMVQGNTLIGGWRLPDKFPDIFIFGPDLISWKDQAALANVPGIAPGTLMPCVVTTPTGDSKADLLAATALSSQNVGVMFFAVNPQQALGMVELEFRDNEGKPYPQSEQPNMSALAAKEMEKGRRVIVTDEFRQAKHLKIGDTMPLLTSKNGMQTYTICGIVWSPGVDVIVSMFDLGHMLDQQTVGSVFGSIDDARRDFGVSGARIFAANLTGGIAKEDLLKNVQKALGERGLRAGDVRHIKYSIENAFQHLLLILSSVAFAAMAVASLGVTNTVMASVRSRRWQFGVLRSVGLTRGELLRLVMAESILLGMVGVALGVTAGGFMSLDARALSGSTLGYSPPIVIPWGISIIGCCAVMFVAIAASLWPAITAARTEVLNLLQSGRASS